jgi:ribonuclease E
LPIECATFLLNEKRHAIEQVESRLKVSIVILPSKHLETPAYDIERIKEKDVIEEKPSYQQIKEEEITIPEFAQQVRQKVEKAAIREFLPESPAPMQKNVSASLIKRFWYKLIGPSILSAEPEPEKKEATTGAPEKIRGADETQPSRSRDSRRGPRSKRGGRGQDRNGKRPSEAANVPEAKSEPDKNEPVAEPEVVEKTAENTAPAVEQQQQKPSGNRSRRGPNRRRPRNPNYKKPESNGDANGEINAVSDEAPKEARSEPRPYAHDFAERTERIERHEPQAHENPGKPVSESPKPVAEPRARVEPVTQESGSDS